jgi:hypothetical protein
MASGRRQKKFEHFAAKIIQTCRNRAIGHSEAREKGALGQCPQWASGLPVLRRRPQVSAILAGANGPQPNNNAVESSLQLDLNRVSGPFALSRKRSSEYD